MTIKSNLFEKKQQTKETTTRNNALFKHLNYKSSVLPMIALLALLISENIY
jgi:hypothetical protein